MDEWKTSTNLRQVPKLLYSALKNTLLENKIVVENVLFESIRSLYMEVVYKVSFQTPDLS